MPGSDARVFPYRVWRESDINSRIEPVVCRLRLISPFEILAQDITVMKKFLLAAVGLFAMALHRFGSKSGCPALHQGSPS